MICRKTLRSFGEIFYLRIQAYTSILLSYAILCVLFLNVIAWTQTRHHVSTIWLLIIIVFSISAVCVFAISKATKLQTLSSDQRDQVQKELFFLEKELMDAENADKTLEFKQFSQAKVLLQQVDESINFHELIHKPTKVMGYAATQSVISSALGIILTGFVLAVEGFSGSGISYDLNGWFNY
jgi:multisubunit Na+/H+ antiporter MnhG subunit